MTSDDSGFVYIVAHPRFPGWIKVGQTRNPDKRLSSYNTGDPDRGYRMIAKVWTKDRRGAEFHAHWRLKRLGYAKQGEWFDAAPALAERIVKKAVADAEGELPLR